MAKTNKGPLRTYVKRIMKQKDLSLRDIEMRADSKITDGYVADILRGTASNPSAEKIKALAVGLGVDAHALFDVVCGPFEPGEFEPPGEDTTDILEFLETMQEVAANPELIKIVDEAIQLLPEERTVVLRSLQSINERRRKLKHRKKSPQSTK
ncbi:MAG: helix-turn-helix domain-containing protein [Blastocatellia bacterium]